MLTRYKLRMCKQSQSELLVAFLRRLGNLMKDCENGEQSSKELRDPIVFGCKDDVHRKKFVTEEYLTLERMIKVCEAHRAYKNKCLFREET